VSLGYRKIGPWAALHNVAAAKVPAFARGRLCRVWPEKSSGTALGARWIASGLEPGPTGVELRTVFDLSGRPNSPLEEAPHHESDAFLTDLPVSVGPEPGPPRSSLKGLSDHQAPINGNTSCPRDHGPCNVSGRSEETAKWKPIASILGQAHHYKKAAP